MQVIENSRDPEAEAPSPRSAHRQDDGRTALVATAARPQLQNPTRNLLRHRHRHRTRADADPGTPPPRPNPRPNPRPPLHLKPVKRSRRPGRHSRKCPGTLIDLDTSRRRHDRRRIDEFTLPRANWIASSSSHRHRNRPTPGGKADPSPGTAAGEAPHEPGQPIIGGGFEVSEDDTARNAVGNRGARRPSRDFAGTASVRYLSMFGCRGSNPRVAFVPAVIHANREWLATHAPFARIPARVYAAMGVSVAAPANLSAYQTATMGRHR